MAGSSHQLIGGSRPLMRPGPGGFMAPAHGRLVEGSQAQLTGAPMTGSRHRVTGDPVPTSRSPGLAHHIGSQTSGPSPPAGPGQFTQQAHSSLRGQLGDGSRYRLSKLRGHGAWSFSLRSPGGFRVAQRRPTWPHAAHPAASSLWQTPTSPTQLTAITASGGSVAVRWID